MPSLATHVWIWIGAFCAWVSFCLIVRLWVMERHQSFLRKVFWSALLLVPLFGWFYYASCFKPPEPHSPGARLKDEDTTVQW
jgi:hypothetical protein